MKSKRTPRVIITVRVEPKFRQELKVLAAKHGLTLQSLIERMLIVWQYGAEKAE